MAKRFHIPDTFRDLLATLPPGGASLVMAAAAKSVIAHRPGGRQSVAEVERTASGLAAVGLLIIADEMSELLELLRDRANAGTVPSKLTIANAEILIKRWHDMTEGLAEMTDTTVAGIGGS